MQLQPLKYYNSFSANESAKSFYNSFRQQLKRNIKEIILSWFHFSYMPDVQVLVFIDGKPVNIKVGQFLIGFMQGEERITIYCMTTPPTVMQLLFIQFSKCTQLSRQQCESESSSFVCLKNSWKNRKNDGKFGRDCSFSSLKHEFYDGIIFPSSVMVFSRSIWDLEWLLTTRACEGWFAATRGPRQTKRKP